MRIKDNPNLQRDLADFISGQESFRQIKRYIQAEPTLTGRLDVAHKIGLWFEDRLMEGMGKESLANAD